MDRKKRHVLLVALLGAALSPSFSGRAQPAPEPPKIETLDGTPFSLASAQGKVVVLDFWASWCLPCRKSFPFLDGLQAKYEAQGLRVLGLTLEERKDAVLSFLESVPVRFTILRDPTGRAGEDFHVVAMPTTLLLDREGRVAARFEGGDPSVHSKIEAAVATLLSGGTLPGSAGVRVAGNLRATGEVKAWQRGYLADPIMNLSGDRLTRLIHEHIFTSKEGAGGDGGASGGGCGCN